MRSSSTPLSPNEQTALAQLEALFEGTDDSVARETAIDHLVTAGFVRGAATDLTEQLRLKGYLYIVEDELYLTDAYLRDGSSRQYSRLSSPSPSMGDSTVSPALGMCS